MVGATGRKVMCSRRAWLGVWTVLFGATVATGSAPASAQPDSTERTRETAPAGRGGLSDMRRKGRALLGQPPSPIEHIESRLCTNTCPSSASALSPVPGTASAAGSKPTPAVGQAEASPSTASADVPRGPPGSLDPSFNPCPATPTGPCGGKEAPPIRRVRDEAQGVAVQPDDGKIVVAGSTFALARYNANGTLDPTFDGDGKVRTDFGGTDDEASALAVQDGKLVVAGVSGGDFALARYQQNGTLDPDFGSSGRVRTPIGNAGDRADALAVQDGKILLGGQSFNPATAQADFALARYNSLGGLDPGFGGAGKVVTDMGGQAAAFGLALAGTDIVAAGVAFAGDDADFALARYGSSGAVDPSFGSNGRVRTSVGNASSWSYDVAVQPEDGKILAVGDSYDGATWAAVVTRSNPDGSADAGFGNGGQLTFSFGGDSDSADGVDVSDGKIVVAGQSAREASSWNSDSPWPGSTRTGPSTRHSTATARWSPRSGTATTGSPTSRCRTARSWRVACRTTPTAGIPASCATCPTAPWTPASAARGRWSPP